MDERSTQMALKIALYVSELDVKGGTHKQVLRLTQYLVRQGHKVQLFTPIFNLAKTFPEFEDIDIVTLYVEQPKSSFSRLFRRLSPIPLAFKLAKVDVLNIHDNGGLLFFFTSWLRRRANCYVWQINDLHHSFRLGNSAKVSARWHHPITRLLNHLMARMVDHITVNVGKNVKRVHEHLGINAELMYCGVDLPTQAVKMSLPPMSPFRVLSTGVFFSFRNYERLVEACANAVTKSGRNIELTIVGDTRARPEYAENIRNIARLHELPLVILENISDEELDREISNCHIFAFVNIDQSWGLAVFETAARKRAVILSNSVGAAELLNGLPGFQMVDPTSIDQIAETILRFIDKPNLCGELGEAAALTVSDMSWDNMYSSKVEYIFKKYKK